MLYLKEKDIQILADAMMLLVGLKMSIPLTTSGNKAIDDYVELFNDSMAYTKKCREKAKQFVQEKRKTDKSYAHTKKKEQ